MVFFPYISPLFVFYSGVLRVWLQKFFTILEVLARSGSSGGVGPQDLAKITKMPEAGFFSERLIVLEQTPFIMMLFPRVITISPVFGSAGPFFHDLHTM